ncbi:MAG: hypothetical protein R3E68_00640 [Burkholderiaceae bacterium]
MNAKPTLLSVALLALTMPAIAQNGDAGQLPLPAGSTRPPLSTPAPGSLDADIRAAAAAPRTDEKQRLESVLATAGSRDDYATLIKQQGYEITAVNKARPEVIEYEIVKGRQTYEVSLNFDKNAQLARSVEVSSNLWRAKETKEKMDRDAAPAAPAAGLRQPVPAER